jgi:hypothetical protein
MGVAAVAGGLVFPGAFVAQRVHQPGLPSVSAQSSGQMAGSIAWPVVGFVLLPQGHGFFTAEVAQAQRLGLDVERAAAGDDFLVGGVHAVVAHIAHAAQDDGLRERARALGIARADLAQQRNQGVADQRVHFVEQQHDGARGASGPLLQHTAHPVGGAGGLQHLASHLAGRFVAPMQTGRTGQGAHDGRHALGHVAARGLRGFDVHIQRAVGGLRVQVLHQRQQAGGFAGLARRVQHEIAFVGNQAFDVFDVDAHQRVDHEMVFGHAGACGVEFFHGVCIVACTAPGAWAGSDQKPRADARSTVWRNQRWALLCAAWRCHSASTCTGGTGSGSSRSVSSCSRPSGFDKVARQHGQQVGGWPPRARR